MLDMHRRGRLNRALGGVTMAIDASQHTSELAFVTNDKTMSR